MNEVITLKLSPNQYKPRILDKKLDLYLSAVGSVLITGPRFTGKTTTGEAHSNSSFSLADSSNNFSNRKLCQTSPDFCLKGELPRLIDEWQIVPQIWDAVRFACDSDGQFGKYILTGSSLASVNTDEIYHSGTGRIATLTMQSMTLFETGDSSGTVSLESLFSSIPEPTPTGKVKIEDLVRYCVRGGWPINISASMEAAMITPREYMRKVIEEDFNSSNRGRKRDPEKIRSAVRAMAACESTAWSIPDFLEKIDSAYSIGRQSIPGYIDVLSKLFIVYQQPAYSLPASKTGSKLLKSSKLRFSDPSLAIAAMELNPEDLFSDMDTLSRFYDCLCVHDLKIYAESFDAQIFHLLEEHGTSADSLIKLKDGRIGIFKHVVGVPEIDRAVQQLSRVRKILTNAGVSCSLSCIVCGMADAVYTVKTSDGEDVVVVPLTALRP